MSPGWAPMALATVSRAVWRASLACCPGEWRLEGLPQKRSMPSSMACWAAGQALVVAALSAYIMMCSISLYLSVRAVAGGAGRDSLTSAYRPNHTVKSIPCQ